MIGLISLTIRTTGSSISFISRFAGTCVGPNGIVTYCIDMTVIRVT